MYAEETGLYYLQSRYYNPATGRFLNADGQISGVGGDIRGYNQFAYCFNNPVNLTDSTGDWPKFLKEIGARIAHGVKIITRIVTSPLKASTLEIGGGVGYGASAKASVLEIPVEVSAYATVTDSYVYDKGSHDARNTSASKIGVNVGNVVDLTRSKGKSHSYFDEECECSFWNSTFGEKSNCVANKKYTSSEATLGISAGLYIGIGFEFSFGFDFKTWGNELISIYHDSLSYEGYY